MSQRKPTILIPIGVYLPGYKGGGPIRSISNLIEELSSDYNFKVLTSAENLKDTGNVPTEQWQRVGNADVRYLSTSEQTPWHIIGLFRTLDVDLIYLNAFFPTPFTLPFLLAKWFGLLEAPIVLAPRGQLYPGAFGQKLWKKSPYLKLAKVLGLYDGVTWHATSERETAQIRKRFGEDTRIQLAPNLGTLPEVGSGQTPNWPTTVPGELNLVFVSRISPKKNLDEAIRIAGEAKGAVTFKIAGPISDEDYWSRCREQIDELPEHIDVQYLGPIPHEDVFELFGNSDLFLFPTQSENYGHVIFEALISGCPVLISRQTPWSGLEKADAGWVQPLAEPEAFVETVQECIDTKESDYRPLRRGAHAFAQEHARPTEAIEQYYRLFDSALQSSSNAS